MMRRCHPLLFLVAPLLFLVSAEAFADDLEPQPQLDLAQQLVAQLGDIEFAARERATAELIRLGGPAMAALREGAGHPDREIRYRSERILLLLEQMDFQSRLDDFLAGRDGPEYSLPAWSQFRALTGDSKTARTLFVEMQKAEGGLLSVMEKKPKETGAELNRRAQQIQQAMQFNRHQLQMSLGTISTLLFAATNRDSEVPAFAAQTVSNYLYQPAFSNAIQANSEQSKILRKMAGEWIKQSEGTNVYQCMMLAMRYNVPEGLVPAEKALKTGREQINQPGNAHLRQYSLLTIARFGDKSHVAQVEPLLEDKTPYGGQIRLNNVNYRTQIRDIALATLVKLDGKKHSDFGFDRLQSHPQYVFNSSTLAFSDDAKRKEAIDKWRASRKNKTADGAGETEDTKKDAEKKDADEKDQAPDPAKP